MAISVASNFSLKNQLPIDNRLLFDTVEDMKNFKEKFLPEMYFCFVKQTNLMYVFSQYNTDDAVTGKWRVFERAETYKHEQTIASNEWIIVHSLRCDRPSVIAFDDDGDEICGDIQYSSQNMIKIKFDIPVTGTCYVKR